MSETAARIARVHVADVVPNTGYGADHWRTPQLTDSTTKIELYSRHQGRTCTWTIGYVGPDGEGRRVDQGPIEPGPYAYLVPEATVIASTRVPGDGAPVDRLAEGDIVIVRGVAFRIDDSHGRAGYNPRLVPITA